MLVHVQTMFVYVLSEDGFRFHLMSPYVLSEFSSHAKAFGGIKIHILIWDIII